MNLPATLLCDFYKISHREQYPDNTQLVYSTWTPRTTRISGIDSVVTFGFQGFIKKYLIDYFDKNFFSRPKSEVVEEYERFLHYTLNIEEPCSEHIAALHDLGYLPIYISAIREGIEVPIRVPVLIIHNTKSEFYWLTNFLETLMSSELWVSMTSATIANHYRKMLDSFAKETGGDLEFVPFQGHDFSMRGMSGLQSSMLSGSGHLLSFVGTDVIPAVLYHEEYYDANIETELVGTSIPATEHSVMCAYGKNELNTYKKIIQEIYPTGMVSIVSDTWDLWKVLTDVIEPLKDVIKSRDGKVVIRPDSGDPVKIVCGDKESLDPLVKKGLIEFLWDTFGGTVTDKGYKVLDQHIGCIYGDAITIDRCRAICENLMQKGFASTNMVFGIGSFTYQYNTRDTFGFALKSTLCFINGQEHLIYKDPKTDNGVKRSQRGKVAVQKDAEGKIICIDGLKMHYNVKGDLLEPLFLNGKLLRTDSLSSIRARLADGRDVVR